MKYFLSVLIMLFVSGCASVANYQPTVNIRADKNNGEIEKDLIYCKALAKQTAGYATSGAEDALVTAGGAAAIGAVSGALITGAVSAGVGAGVGAGIGGIGGLWYGLYDADERYKRSFNSCMSQLGHPVLW